MSVKMNKVVQKNLPVLMNQVHLHVSVTELTEGRIGHVFVSNKSVNCLKVTFYYMCFVTTRKVFLEKKHICGFISQNMFIYIPIF